MLVGLVLVMLMLVAACGEADANSGNSDSAAEPTPTEEPIAYPQGADDVVVRIENTGGFVPQEFLVTHMPVFSLYGDGRAIIEGPQIMIYPGPALPNLQMGTLTDEGIQKILEAAAEAGLLDGDKHYTMDGIADAGTTVFTVTANGVTHTVSAYALDITSLPGIPAEDAEDAEDVEARQKLIEFQQKMVDYTSWLPATAIAEAQAEFPIERLQIVTRPAGLNTPSDESVKPGEQEWPLEIPLAEIGEPFPFMEQARCAVIEGADLDTLMPALRDANQITRWTSDGEEYSLLIRPLLPDEQGCQQPILGQ